jgi:hypothetical protein
MVLWRYESRWQWTYSGKRVTAANHAEYSRSLFPGWAYLGSRYLWPTGRVGTFTVGRATEGHFRLGPIKNVSIHRYPKVDFHAHGDGSYWGQCLGA